MRLFLWETLTIGSKGLSGNFHQTAADNLRLKTPEKCHRLQCSWESAHKCTRRLYTVAAFFYFPEFRRDFMTGSDTLLYRPNHWTQLYLVRINKSDWSKVSKKCLISLETLNTCGPFDCLKCTGCSGVCPSHISGLDLRFCQNPEISSDSTDPPTPPEPHGAKPVHGITQTSIFTRHGKQWTFN